MKTILTAVLVLAATWAQATLTPVDLGSVTMAGSGTIPDGNPVGVSFAGSYSTAPSGYNVVAGVTVGLNISGGYNGDLYAYLIAPNGTVVVLMNQPGVTGGNPFGASSSGMSVILQDGAGTSIQNMGNGTVSGTYSAAGNLSSFDGSSADGTWTLFFADVSGGDGTGTLTSWSLDLSVVPEPAAMALLMFLVMLLALAGLRWAWRT